MNKYIKIIEKMGQSQSINQYDSVQQMISASDVDNQAFANMIKKSNDLICALLPDDDDDEE